MKEINNFIKKPEHVIKPECFVDRYSDLFSDFSYYENSDLNDIKFDGRHDLGWFFFTQEGIMYLLPLLIESGDDSGNFSVMHDDFIQNFAIDEHLYGVINLMSKDEMIILKKWFEYLLFDQSEQKVEWIGEHFLFRNLEKIESFLHTL